MVIKKSETVEVRVINKYRDYGIWESEIVSVEHVTWSQECTGLKLNGILLPKECEIVVIDAVGYDYNIIDYIEKVYNGETILCVWHGLGYQVLIGKDFLKYFDKNM